MTRPALHVFVCSQQRPPQHPRGSCAAAGSAALLLGFWSEAQKRASHDRVAITYSGCLGPCEGGPNVVVYPEGVLYQGVKPGDVGEIFDEHLEGGRVVEGLRASGTTW
jgi:(2Fe-2S) ferredoxin